MISILYVDDENALLEVTKMYLETREKLVVDIAESANRGLEKLQCSLYDVIVSDYQMPEMDGIAFLKAVRSQNLDIPFILFTGRGREEVVIEAINNGADFYLQKGGDPKAQFAELAHKIRQAVARRKAENLRIESEKRLADIINFLPDATFAIDKAGHVIAWNRAIEEMTGVPAADMLGKGEYEYAIPFYGGRRKLLIDLIFEPDDVIAKNYENIIHEKDILIADSTFPGPKGRPVTFVAKASPLYDRQGGVVGAIESIRDITDRKLVEEELREQYEVLAKNEQQLRENELRLNYMLGFSKMAQEPEKELLAYAVEGAGAVTGSPLGYLAFLNHDETQLTMYAWSKTAMEECAIRDKPIIYPVEKTGLWGEAVRERRPVITNDYQAPNPKKKGYPDGHPIILRHMNVPIMDGDHIVIVAGVANKPSDYTEDEVRELTLLMQGLWQVLKRRRAEEELLAANEQLTASERELRRQFEELAATEIELQKQQQQLTEVAEMIPGLVYQFYARPDGSMGLYYVSKRSRSIFGFPGGTDDFFGWFNEHIDPRDREEYTRSIDEAIREEKAWNFEGRFIKPSGKQIWFQGLSRPVRRGSELIFNGILFDTTNRKLAELSIQEKEQKYRTVIETAEEGIWIVNPDFLTVFTNRKLQEIFGYTQEEMMGRPVWDFVLPDEVESMKTALFERKSGKSGRYERRWLRKDGTVIWCLTSGTPLFLPDETFTGSFGMFTDITKRKEMEEALRESEAKYRTVVEQSNDAIFIAQESRLVFHNPALAAMTGYADTELKGRAIADLIAPEDRDMVMNRHRERLSGKVLPETYEFSVLHHDMTSRIRVVMNISSGTFDGKPATIGTLHNVTEERRREEALRESEENYRSIIEHVQDVVYRSDCAGNLIMVSPSFVTKLGYDSVDECLGKNIAQQFWMYPERRQEFLAELVKNGYISGYEVILKKKDGTPILVSTSSHFFYGRDGKIAGVEGIFHDITALRESQQQIQILAGLNDISPASVIVHTPEGEMLYANQRTIEMHGWTRDEFMSLNLHQIDVPASEELINRRVEQLRRTGETAFDVEHFRKDGSTIPLHVNAKLTRWHDHEVILSVSTDITERRQAMDALEKSYAELEHRVHERTRALRESEERLKLKLDSILSSECEISNLELVNVLDIPVIQSMMEDFSTITGMATAIVDLKGTVIEATGWQDICTKFHRINERTAQFCTESDLYLTENLRPGEYRAYKCKNNLWDMVTPLYIGGNHVGNIYMGQFFYEDEIVDETFFIARAEEFGFNREEYISALRQVPRVSRDRLTTLMKFLVEFTHLISQLSYRNVILARTTLEEKKSKEALI